MTTRIPPFAPGCFGSALAYQGDNSFCRACVFQAECEPLHQQTLAALRARFGIKVAALAKAATDKNGGALAVPQKVQALIERFERCGIRITEKLAEGQNPFASNFAFMKIACHLLLKLGRPVDRKMLTAAFTSKLDWAPPTAESHARMAFQALIHIGAVDEIDGRIQIRRS